MSLYDKAKETIFEYAILSILAVVGLLSFVIWQAVPSTLWEGINNAVDKKVLWALSGLLLLVVVSESIYLIQTNRKARRMLHHFGGVMWNSNCDMFCPKDETPIYKSGQMLDEENPSREKVEIFQCPKCDSNYVLKDAEGNSIPLEKAKKNFLIKQSIQTKGSLQAPDMVEGFDDITIKVLRGFGSTTMRSLKVDNFTGLLNSGVKPGRISHSLDILHKKGYITIPHSVVTYVGANTLYELTPKGREYIVKNNIV